MAKVGYARVSSNTQDYQGQVDALKAFGCERIYSEKQSGKSTDGQSFSLAIPSWWRNWTA